jgi:two-component system, NarL family, response regulator DevR
MRRKAQNNRRRWQSSTGIVPVSSRVTSVPSRSVRVFIAARCELVRVGLRALLEEERDLIVVGEADEVEKLLSGLRRVKPDVVVHECWVSDGSESTIYKKLFSTLPSVRILSLIEDDCPAAFRSAVEGRAQGYLWQNAGRIELVRAIRTVAKEGSYLGLEGMDQAFGFLRQQQDPVCSRSELQSLLPQERRIIALIAEGGTNKEIAAKMVLSDKTVKNYIASMFSKLGISRRTQAVSLYVKTLQPHTPMGEGIFT